jgi:DnaJ-class molecular chaperone
MTYQKKCHPCEGQGYTEIRDCSGDIQRTEKCSFCEGLGYIEVEKEQAELEEQNVITKIKKLK